ncbi:MAG: hypothetical protein KA169_03605 [Burkholderiaceae bacterium]|nr:hypothetical protein [Burkholderiaceae bacterium]
MAVSNQATRSKHPPVIFTLAYLLEKLEQLPGPIGADQHRWVVDRLSQALAQAEPGPELDAMLDVHPGVAELYENLHYAHAGLCRHPLDSALSAEQSAQRLIARVRAGQAPQA